jgi:hypothetical protein
MKNAFLILARTFVFATLSLSGSAMAQDADARLISSPPFALSEAATATRIEGNLKVDLTVDKSGKVKNVVMWSLPAWPCGTNPKKEINEVLDAVKANILATTFSPAIWDGKPHDSVLRMTFVVGKSYRNIVRQTGIESVATLEGAPPRFIEPGTLNGRAVYVPKPEVSSGVLRSAAYGDVTAQLLISETGDVISVGFLFGPGILFPPVRAAACAAKFRPLLIRGQPVQVSGIFEYRLEQGPYVPKINTRP